VTSRTSARRATDSSVAHHSANKLHLYLFVITLATIIAAGALSAGSANAQRIGKVNVTDCASSIKAVNYTVKRVAVRKAEIKYLRTNNAKRNRRAKQQLARARAAAKSARAAVRFHCAGGQGVNAQSGPCFSAIETFERSVNLAAETRIKTKRVRKGKKLTRKQVRRRAKTLKRLDDTVRRSLQTLQTSCTTPSGSGDGGTGDGGDNGQGTGGDNGNGQGGGQGDTQAPSLTVDGPDGSSNNPNPSYTVGSDDSEAAIECRVDDGAWTAVANGGSYNPGPLADGTHTIECVATDGAGNQTTTIRTVTVDTQAPGAASIDGPVKTSDTTPSYTVDSDVGTTTQCWVGDHEQQQTVADGGNYEPTLTEGAHTITCESTDGAGNTSQSTKDVTVDTTAPTAPGITGPSNTDDTTPIFTVDSEAGTTTVCWVGAHEQEQTVADGGTYEPTLAEGTHTITCESTDGAGNTSQSTKNVTVDTTDPAAPGITGPTDTDDTTPPFTVDSDDDTTTICWVGDHEQEQNVPDGGTYQPTLTEGTHTITCVSTDAAGNTSTTTWTVTIDTTAPAAPTIGGPSITSDATPQFPVDSSDDATTECWVGDHEQQQTVADGGNYEPTLTEGAHTITCESTDGAGNTSQSTKDVTVDTTAPTAPGIDGPAATNDTTPIFTITTDEPATICWTDNHAQSQTVANGGTYTPTLTAGPHTITCESTDGAGNTSQSTKDVVIGNAYTDPVTKTSNGDWGLACTPLNFILPLGCPSGVVSHTIPAHPNGLTGNYTVDISGAIQDICSIGGVFPTYTMHIVVDGQSVASDWDGGIVDLLCLFPTDLAAQKLNLTLSASTAHTISINLRSNLQLSLLPNYNSATLSVDIKQL
jgi:hypothetical protein